MRTLTYTGRANRRRLGPDDGLDTAREFVRGVPLEVSDADGARIIDAPELYGADFTEGEPTEAADDQPSGDAGDYTDEEA